jgi:hypothetical protein
MSLPIGRNAKLRKQLTLLKLNIVGEVRKFTDDVSDVHHSSTRRRAAERALATGALSFFLYALEQACRPSCTAAEIDIVLSGAATGASLDLVNIQGVETARSEAEALPARMERMNSHLANASSLLGARLEDRDSALWLAAVVISAESDPSDQAVLVYLVQSRLLLGLIRLNLTKRVQAIVALMH